MNNSFIADCTELIHSMPELTGDAARLAYRLSAAINRLEAVQKHANDQFSVDCHTAKFGIRLIQNLDRAAI